MLQVLRPVNECILPIDFRLHHGDFISYVTVLEGNSPLPDMIANAQRVAKRRIQRSITRREGTGSPQENIRRDIVVRRTSNSSGIRKFQVFFRSKVLPCRKAWKKITIFSFN